MHVVSLPVVVLTCTQARPLSSHAIATQCEQKRVHTEHKPHLICASQKLYISHTSFVRRRCCPLIQRKSHFLPHVLQKLAFIQKDGQGPIP